MRTRRSRHSNISIRETPRSVKPSPLFLEVFELLWRHKFVPSRHIQYLFPQVRKKQGFITDLGIYHESQNDYIRRSRPPLNFPRDNNRPTVWELAPNGARAIGRKVPAIKGDECEHDFLTTLLEVSFRAQSLDKFLPFFYLDQKQYTLHSGRRWDPDGHPLIIGDDILWHTEIERKKWREKPADTEEKIEKAYEYVQSRMWANDAKSTLVGFLSTTTGRTNALKSYVKDKYTKCPFFLFATTKDWAWERSFPHPASPLVPIWERVGYPPITADELLAIKEK